MKLSRVHNTKELCRWFYNHGLTPGENAHVDRVDRVHTIGSWHYKTTNSAGITYEPASYQGTCGIDLNELDVRDTWFYRMKRGDWHRIRPQTETEALNWVYNKLRRVQRRKHWPMAEMFFNRRGYKDDYGWSVNVPISGHEGHLHVGFTKDRW